MLKGSTGTCLGIPSEPTFLTDPTPQSNKKGHDQNCREICLDAS